MWQEASRQLREDGAAVLRGACPVDLIERLKTAAERCFLAVEQGQVDPAKYRFTPFSYSASIEALRDFGVDDPTAPLRVNGIEELLTEAMGCHGACGLADSWTRKRFALSNAPPRYRPNTWHQDGGLRVAYGAGSAPSGPMTRLITCWIPLQDCGRESPGLEFVRQRVETLLHYQDLDDTAIHKRFSKELFWQPELVCGDVLVFLSGTPHRTHVRPEMRLDRLSVEYRFFPLFLAAV